MVPWPELKRFQQLSWSPLRDKSILVAEPVVSVQIHHCNLPYNSRH